VIIADYNDGYNDGYHDGFHDDHHGFDDCGYDRLWYVVISISVSLRSPFETAV
jgi:hypothetical protein